ncbi:MAG: hypothetical protein GY854_19415 [Deltaproteobacteria bacterium]|nr:hypothetical protein [Deltaproteobacteria bacterium]
MLKPRLFVYPGSSAARAIARVLGVVLGSDYKIEMYTDCFCLEEGDRLLVYGLPKVHTRAIWEACISGFRGFLTLDPPAQEELPMIASVIADAISTPSHATGRILTVIFHDIFKNQYLIQGRKGLARMRVEYPLWLDAWKAGPCERFPMVTERAEKLSSILDQATNDRHFGRRLRRQVERLNSALVHGFSGK